MSNVAPLVAETVVEMDLGDALLDTAGRELLDTYARPILDTGWVNVTADTRASVPISIRRGNFGSSAKDRVGNIGTLKLALDNSEHNSAGLLGYYSPGHPNARLYFSEDARIRVSLRYGAKKRYKFQGRVTEIRPDSGVYGRRIVMISAEDWFGEAAETPMVGLSVQVDKRDDELLTTLMTIFDHPPVETDFSTGEDTYALAFTDELGESTQALSVLQKIAMSGMSTIFLQGNASHGEILVYRTRVDNGDASQTAVATLENSMVSMAARRSRKKRIKAVRTTVYPAEVDAAATTKLFSLQREIVLAPGESVKFTGRYVDPTSRKRIAGTDIVTPLVAGTHYKFSSSSGSGEDLNSDLTIVSFSPGADSGEIEVRNDAAVTGYLWFMEWYGKGIYRDSPLDYTAENENISHGVVLRFDMPYQDDFDLGISIAEALESFYEENETDVQEVRFIANRSETLMDALLDVEPGMLVGIMEDVTGVNGLFYANGHDYIIHKGGRRVDVVWSLVPAKLFEFFELDSSSHGLDDSNSGALSY